MRRQAGKRAWVLLCALALSMGLLASAAAADTGQETRFETLEDFTGVVMGTGDVVLLTRAEEESASAGTVRFETLSDF